MITSVHMLQTMRSGSVLDTPGPDMFLKSTEALLAIEIAYLSDSQYYSTGKYMTHLFCAPELSM